MYVTAGVNQGTVLGPSLFLIYINDLPLSISSTMRLFADDCFQYRSINSPVDCQNIQNDLYALIKWEKDWQTSFNVDKCHTICFSIKKSNLDTTYVLNNHVLTKVHHYSYLGVILSEDRSYKWSQHIAHMTSSAKQSLGIIKGNLRNVYVDCKSKLNNSLVRPTIEYANSAWYKYLQKDVHRLDMNQSSAARLCFNNYSKEPGVVIDMLYKLEWPSLEGRRILSRSSMFHRIVYRTVDINKDSYLTSLPRTSRSGNSKTFIRPHSNMHKAFFPCSVNQWNRLPGDIVNIDDNLKFKIIHCR